MFPERWPAFVGVLLVVLCVPGPDFVVIFRYAIASPPAGIRAAAGNIAGLAVHTGLAAFGVAAVAAAHPVVLDVIRLAGAGYLGWLGAAALHSWYAGSRRTDVTFAGRTPDRIPGHPFQAGLATNLLNPKAILFFVGVIPQFISRDGNVTVQTLVLAATTIVLATAWWMFVIHTADRGARVLLSPATRSVLDGVSGVALLCLAAFVVAGSMI